MFRAAFGVGLALLLLLPGAAFPGTDKAAGDPAAAPSPPGAASSPIATITYAEHNGRLLRATSLFTAGRGTQLAADDLFESGTGNTQLDVVGATVALGPESRLYLRSGELLLLSGWMKVRAASATANGAAPTLATAAARLTGLAAGATVIVHAAAGATELFAESGELAVTELAGGKAQRQFKLPAEQFAARSGALPFKVQPRPASQFLSAMPPSFLDTMVAIAVKGAPLPPRLDRSAAFNDVAPWLAEQPALRLQIQRRFQPSDKPPARAAASAPAPPQRVSDMF